MGVELDDGEQVEELASNHLLCLAPASYLAMLLQPPGSLEEAEEENGKHGVLLRLVGWLESGHLPPHQFPFFWQRLHRNHRLEFAIVRKKFGLSDLCSLVSQRLYLDGWVVIEVHSLGFEGFHFD